MNIKLIALWRVILLISFLILMSCTERNSSESKVPDWNNIKNNTVPSVAFTDEYETPYIQPHSTLAWEDGVFISRDGLHMYAFYTPLDLLQYIEFVSGNSSCNNTADILPFFRGPLLTMDFTTNPWGCPILIHSDIAYTNRLSVLDNFNPWEIANLSNPYYFDGGFSSLDNSDGTIDILYSRSTESNKNDLFWARSVSHNPPFESDIVMPSPINTPEQEDNPYLERLDASTLVLLFDNHGIGDSRTVIKYSISTDNGAEWSVPVVLGGNINAGPHDMQGHLYFDGTDWWFYFTSERNGRLSIFRSKHNKSVNIKTNFDNWGNVELVIGPGVISNNSGFIAGVGEPTLTSDGDISFVVVYATHEDDNSYDRFEIDPWYLPRKKSSRSPKLYK